MKYLLVLLLGTTLQNEAQPQTVVYYFHNHFRCQTCLNMESMVAETVDNDFISELNQGTLEMRVVDVESEGQGHFTEDFKLDGPTLILVEYDKNHTQKRWVNLDRIWDYCDQHLVFKKYVTESIEAFIAGEKISSGE